MPGPIANLQGAVDANNNLLVAVAASASGSGWTPYSYIAAASSNQDSQSVKGSAGQLGYISVFSTITTPRYVKIYDKATAPTSADTPVYRCAIPGNTTGAGSNLPIPSGVKFVNGIGFRITQGVADNDATAVSANDVIVNLGFL